MLLHGLTATRRYVVMGSRSLERSGHRVIAYDARGHGRSSPAAEPRRLRATTTSAPIWRPCWTRCGIERAVLAGASMGAHTLLWLALHAPRAGGGAGRHHARVLDRRQADDPERLAHWDALSRGLRSGGIDGFLAAQGEPRVPERWRETVVKVIRQRLSAHEHLDAVADALHVVPALAPVRVGRGPGRDLGADGDRRLRRRRRPRASAGDRGGLRRGDPGRAAGDRRAGQVAGRVAGQPALAR